MRNALGLAHFCVPAEGPRQKMEGTNVSQNQKEQRDQMR